MSSHNHEVLKIKAIEWLYQVCKCKYIATEVKIGKYIYDVVGADGSRVFIIEAKAQHGDFLKDCNRPEDIKKEIKELKETLEENSNLKKYKKDVTKLREKSTKFYDKAILKLSSARYIIAPQLTIDLDEVPEDWGLLDEDPRTVLKCERNRIDKKYSEKIIRDICKKNTKKYLESIGVEFGKIIVFPEVSLHD